MPDLNQIVDSLSALTVIEAAELVKKLEEKWGVSAAAVAVAAPGAATGPAAAPVEEKTEFTVVLTSAGAKDGQRRREQRRSEQDQSAVDGGRCHRRRQVRNCSRTGR